jgi:hypothetical protein
MYKSFSEKWREQVAQTYALDVAIKGAPIDRLTEEQLKKWSSSLEQMVLYNRIALFCASRLREYQRSGFSFFSSIMTIMALLVATVLSFAGINFAIFKIDASNFDASGSPSFFTFVYYSLNAVLFNFVKEVTPSTSLGQAIWMIEVLFAFFLVIIFIALMFQVRSQRHAEDLSATIGGLEEDGAAMEAVIRTEYNIDNISLAIAELERLKAGMLQILLFFTRNLN